MMPRPLIRESFYGEDYLLVARYPGSRWRLVRAGLEEARWVRLADLRDYGLTDDEMAEAKYEALAPPEGNPWRAT